MLEIDDAITELLARPEIGLRPEFSIFLEKIKRAETDWAIDPNRRVELHQKITQLWTDINSPQLETAEAEVVRRLEKRVITFVGKISKEVRTAMNTFKKSGSQIAPIAEKMRLYSLAITVYAAMKSLEEGFAGIENDHLGTKFDIQSMVWHSEKMEEQSSGISEVLGEGLESPEREFKYFNADGTQLSGEIIAILEMEGRQPEEKFSLVFEEWIARSDMLLEDWLSGRIDDFNAYSSARRLQECGFGADKILKSLQETDTEKSSDWAALANRCHISYRNLYWLFGAVSLINDDKELRNDVSIADRKKCFDQVREDFERLHAPVGYEPS